MPDTAGGEPLAPRFERRGSVGCWLWHGDDERPAPPASRSCTDREIKYAALPVGPEAVSSPAGSVRPNTHCRAI